MDTSRKIKVLLTRIGLDGHDRGYRLVAGALRDAGMEVILTGPWLKIEEVVSIAEQEDVDVIGISSLSCDHLLVPKLMNSLSAAQMSDVLVIVGGIVPDEDVPLLERSGVARVFHPGSSLAEIVTFIQSRVTTQPPTRDPGGSHGYE
jgi:methylmalonyl-CoA mutase C-terminal domain/subunit